MYMKIFIKIYILTKLHIFIYNHEKYTYTCIDVPTYISLSFLNECSYIKMKIHQIFNFFIIKFIYDWLYCIHI